MPRLIDADGFVEDLKTEAMNLYLDGMKGTPRNYRDLYDIIDRIAEQPTIDAEPVRHGRWVLVGADKRGRGGVFNCTACNRCHPHKSDYCPNCGAKMDGDGDADQSC